MTKHALVVIAPGSEEMEAVACIDVLVRGGIKVTVASACPQGKLQITASRGVKLV
ncbi:MAG: DJ-1/PfpI family protein, partial [Aeromonadaceae bacterium]|nr:DJ-1/PfpI family protein [Aeromonadaceae bacterium]